MKSMAWGRRSSNELPASSFRVGGSVMCALEAHMRRALRAYERDVCVPTAGSALWRDGLRGFSVWRALQRGGILAGQLRA